MTTEQDTSCKIVIVGGVAGGASTAARLRRLDEDAEIVVLERSGYVSFANCGLPYHLSDTIEQRDDLLLQTPSSLYERFRIDVRVRNEVQQIDAPARRLTVKNLETGDVYEQAYDSLVLSPGASAIVPPIPGADRGLVLRSIEDLDRMVVEMQAATDVVIVGGGFIGLEAAENLAATGRRVTIVELGDQILAPLDPEMAYPLQQTLESNGVNVETGCSVVAIEPDAAVLSDGRTIPADFVILSIGVRPDTHLAREADVEIGPLGGIKVDANMKTSNPHIWAVGDAVEKADLIGSEQALMPLANIANREGRRAADSILGRPVSVQPGQATAIVQAFGFNAATTGWNEKRLKAAGRAYQAIHTHATDHAGYYPGAEALRLKLLFDPADGAILGAQAIGRAGVDKRIDVLATALRTGMMASDLLDLELAYAPQFGSAKDPINQLGYIAENRMSGLSQACDWSEVAGHLADGWQLLDVRTADEVSRGMIPGAVHIPVDELRDRVQELSGDRFIVYCAVGQRAHVAARYLRSKGFEVQNLDGGWSTWELATSANGAASLVGSVN